MHISNGTYRTWPKSEKKPEHAGEEKKEQQSPIKIMKEKKVIEVKQNTKVLSQEEPLINLLQASAGRIELPEQQKTSIFKRVFRWLFSLR